VGLRGPILYLLITTIDSTWSYITLYIYIYTPAKRGAGQPNRKAAGVWTQIRVILGITYVLLYTRRLYRTYSTQHICILQLIYSRCEEIKRGPKRLVSCLVLFKSRYNVDREYGMIYRGSSFLAVVWFGSCLIPLWYLFSVFLWFACRAYWREREVGRGWGRSQIIRRRESLVICKSFTTLWCILLHYPHDRIVICFFL
jgi:hypothetical protein